MKLYTRLAAALLISGTCVLTANAQLYWDIDTISQAGAGGTAPTGVWDDTTAHWNSNASGTGIPGVWDDGTPTQAVFAAGGDATGAYTVTVPALRQITGIAFEEGNVTIDGAGGLQLNDPSTFFDVASGASGTISTTITGSPSIVKNGVGTLTLSADNNAAGFAGGLDVNNGTLYITNGNAIGLGGDFTPATVHDGATLQVGGAAALTNATALNINGNGFGGNGAIRKTDNVAVTMSGGLTLGSASRIQSERNTLTISGAPIVTNGFGLTFAGTVSGNTGNITVSTTINGTDNVVTKEGQGTLTLSGNNISTWLGTPKLRINGGIVSIASDNGFTNNLGAAPAANTADAIILRGGTLRNTIVDNTGSSFVRTARGIQLGALTGTVGSGTVEKTNTVNVTLNGQATQPVSTIAIYQGTIGLETGMTEGTLTKAGVGEFRGQGDGGITNAFTKLNVTGGMYRHGNGGTNPETWWGAAPAAPLDDAITINGGWLGLSLNETLNANRGITIGPNGGGFNAGGGIASAAGGYSNVNTTMIVPGKLSGSGTLKLWGLSNTTGNSSGGLTLQNVANNTSFTGAVQVDTGLLTLSESLTAKNLSSQNFGTVPAPSPYILLGSTPTTPYGTVSIASGKTFTVGGDGTSTMYFGIIAGAGTLTKNGAGTLTTGYSTGPEWTNTGGVVINGGTIKYGATSAGLATTVPVTINNTATLDMNGANDTFGSLVSSGANTTGQVLQGVGNLTLGQTAATARSYSGTITGTGTFTKGGGAWTQTLTGNNTLGAVNVTLGRLNLNGTNTTGAVTVSGTGTLGGTGSVTGAVSVQTGATLAPGTSIGTFGEGALTMASGSTFQYELNTSGTPAADLLNVNGALSLGGATLFTDDLNASPITLAGGSKFTLMSYAGAWDSSTFAGINNGDTVSVDGIGYKIKYDDVSAGSLNAGSLYASAVTLSIPGSGSLPGDFNNDGHIDAGDYVSIRKQFSDITSGGGLTAYSAWRQNFGSPPGAGSGGGLSGAGAVPEPSAIALLMIGLAAIATRRRGR